MQPRLGKPTWEREDFERYIEGGHISSINMDVMGQLVINYGFVAGGKNKIKGSLRGQWLITEDMPAYKTLLEITGPMSPGDSKYFSKPYRPEVDYPLLALAQGLEADDCYRTAEMQEDGSIWLTFQDPKIPNPLKFPPTAEHINMILKRTGPMKPGDVVEL